MFQPAAATIEISALACSISEWLVRYRFDKRSKETSSGNGTVLVIFGADEDSVDFQARPSIC